MLYVKEFNREKQGAGETLLGHEVQKGPPRLLNSLSERILVVSVSSLIPRLRKQFMSEGLWQQFITD